MTVVRPSFCESKQTRHPAPVYMTLRLDSENRIHTCCFKRLVFWSPSAAAASVLVRLSSTGNKHMSCSKASCTSAKLDTDPEGQVKVAADCIKAQDSMDVDHYQRGRQATFGDWLQHGVSVQNSCTVYPTNQHHSVRAQNMSNSGCVQHPS